MKHHMVAHGNPRGQLGQALLDNAIHHTERGDAMLRVRAGGHGAVLAVGDTGCGIAQERIDRLVDRFYRTDGTPSPKQGGSGLCLGIARWIAEAHAGEMRVASEPGRGSTFTVSLPRSGT
jgi:signal transduction histidine kinase